MTPKADTCVLCLTLTLALLAAVMTAPAHASDVYRKLLWFVAADGAAELSLLSGAVPDPSSFPVSP